MSTGDHRGLRAVDSFDSPSAWSHRLPAALLALVGFGIATYLALYQTGALASVWEPVFGAGSHRILTSTVATLLPVPDAALGATAYLVEAVMLLVGGTDRWRAQPWLVLLLGVVAATMALGAIVLVAVQAFAFGTGCTLCLASAGISLVLARLAAPEVVDTLAHIRNEHWRGRPLWRSMAGSGASHDPATHP